MLYFFHGVSTAVVTHGMIKEREIPEKSIQVAINIEELGHCDDRRQNVEESGRG